jgi:hypothetical protein
MRQGATSQPTRDWACRRRSGHELIAKPLPSEKWPPARSFPPKTNSAPAARGFQDVDHSAPPRSTHGCREGISRAFEPLTFRDANPVKIDQGSRCTLQATEQLFIGNSVAFRWLKKSDLAISPQNSNRLTALGTAYVAADPISEFADFDSLHPQKYSQVT